MAKSYLSYCNNWETDEYYVGKKKVSSLNEIEFKDVKYNVISEDVTVPYNDMGHTYHATSKHYFIEQNVLGVAMKIDLRKIVPKNSKIKATKFTVSD